MAPLYTVAFPSLGAADAAWIDDFRQRHDADRRRMIAAHYTLVFGCTGVEVEAYAARVAAVAASFEPIPFECRSAVPGADDEAGMAQVHLVPDHGGSRLTQLHDRLYTGSLRRFLRLDLPYLPHITIGQSRDRLDVQAWCDGLNARGVRVAGVVRELTVGTVRAGVFEALSTHALGASRAAGPADR